MPDTPRMTIEYLERDIRSGAVRLVPVEATLDMSAAGEVALVDVLHGIYYSMPNDGMRRVLRSAIAASPDHTPALVALIEERDRLKVERDEALVGWTFEFLGYDGEWGRSFAFLDQGEPANGTGAIVRNVVPVRRAT